LLGSEAQNAKIPKTTSKSKIRRVARRRGLPPLQVRQHLPAEAEQPGLVAVDDHLEGVIVAAAKHRHQTLVSLQSQQGRPPGEQPATTSVC